MARMREERAPSKELTQTFHPFPHLPKELRLQIWRLTATQSRDVLIRRTNRPSQARIELKEEVTPPTSLLVCKESRDETLRYYQRPFIAHPHLAHIYYNNEFDDLYLRDPLEFLPVLLSGWFVTDLPLRCLYSDENGVGELYGLRSHARLRPRFPDILVVLNGNEVPWRHDWLLLHVRDAVPSDQHYVHAFEVSVNKNYACIENGPPYTMNAMS